MNECTVLEGKPFSVKKIVIRSNSRLDQTRDLGVILDSKLTFLPHIDATVAKANRMLGLIMRSMQLPRTHNRLNHKPLITVFNAHVRSLVEYGCIVWAGAAHTHLKRLERLQHKFLIWLARRSDKPSTRTDYISLMSHFHVPSIKSRFAHYDLMFMYNLFHERFDVPDLLRAFSLNAPTRITRTSSLWAVPFARVDTVLRGLFRRAPQLCNMFLCACPTVDFFTSSQFSFKKSLIGYTSSLGSFL